MEPETRALEDMACKPDFRGSGASDIFVSTFSSHPQSAPADRGIHVYASPQQASSSADIRLYAVAGQQAMPNVDMQSLSFAAPHQLVLPPPPPGQVMTDEQLETLRRQISVYATICQQLVEMHKAIMAQQGSGSGIWLSNSIPFDSSLHPMSHRLTSRQRWTPSQNQLHILERLFEQESGTPNKQRIKEITLELSQHGQISETNVYNWFQNRRARTKRKQQLGGPNNGESEFDTDAELPDEKKGKIEADFSNYNLDAGQVISIAPGADTMEHQQGLSDFAQRHGQPDNTTACYVGTQGVCDRSRTQLLNSGVWDISFSLSESKPDLSAFSGSQEFQGRQIIITGAKSQS